MYSTQQNYSMPEMSPDLIEAVNKKQKAVIREHLRMSAATPLHDSSDKLLDVEINNPVTTPEMIKIKRRAMRGSTSRNSPPK